jgi:hypothetical protein
VKEGGDGRRLSSWNLNHHCLFAQEEVVVGLGVLVEVVNHMEGVGPDLRVV